MSIVPDTQSFDVNGAPQVPYPHNNNSKSNNRRGSDPNSRKRKSVPTPVVKSEGATPGEGQPFTPDEERNFKRQRRLVKNREAAQLFRQRQKAYIQDLERKVQDLAGANNEFRARVELLTSENKLIKEQLLYLRNFVTQAVSFSFPKVASPGGIPTSIASLALGNLTSSSAMNANIAGLLNSPIGSLSHSLHGPPGCLSLNGPSLPPPSICSSTTTPPLNINLPPTSPPSLPTTNTVFPLQPQQLPQRTPSPTILNMEPAQPPPQQLSTAGAASK